jgi:aminomethyltransferase
MGPKNITPLYKKHLELEAYMVDFAGYRMPMQYSSIFEEVKAVRDSAGLFDVSHMGDIEVSGEQATEFINYLVTFDISKLKKFQAKYTVILNEKGGIIDDLMVYNLGNKYLIVVNASTQEKDLEWFLKHKNGQVQIRNAGDEYFQIALQGPLSEKIIKGITGNDVSKLKFYHSKEEKISNLHVLISRTGYTGEDGFEIYGKSEEAEKIWDVIMEEGKQYDISPCGLGARDLLRLEMGYCLYGTDITTETTPLEANLSWVVSFDKEFFIGKDILLKKKREGVKRKLAGIRVPGRRIPRYGYNILKKRKEIGVVTSGNFSPTLNSSIALGYIQSNYEKEGTRVEVEIRDKLAEGEIVRLPFWKNGSLRRRFPSK